MKQFIAKHKTTVASVMLCLVFGAIMLSFADSPIVNQFTYEQEPYNDTVPLKKSQDNMTMKEFDQLVENMDKEIYGIGEEIKKIDLEKIQKQVELSLKAVDVEKIMKEAELSINKVNIDKIMSDVKSSLEQVDWDKNKEEMSAALREASRELEKAKIELRNINQEMVKKELEQTRREIEKTREEIKKIDINKIMGDAKKEMAYAKAGLKELRNMFTEMEKEGLINTKTGFRIIYKNNELFINSARQPATVTDKYKKYFKEDPFEIEISGE